MLDSCLRKGDVYGYMTKYESLAASICPAPSPGRRFLLSLWTAGGLIGLMVFIWAEPFSWRLFAYALHHGVPAWLIRYLGVPMVMAVRGVLLVEVIGYLYHRFFQHLGYLTRKAQVFRRNQMYHWVHHMVIYPIGRFYKKAMPYVDAEEGIAWSWVAPAVITVALALYRFGFNVGTLAFAASIAIYAKMFVETAHQRFHIAQHPWTDSPYFQWLEKIHILHHWDQRTNFTIVHPLMDMLFGTYLSPETHEREIDISLADEDLTVSDLINWGYLLLEASPAEYAAFISQARRHPRSVRKLDRLIDALREQLERHPEDMKARNLYVRTVDLSKLVHPSQPAVLAAA